MTNTQWKRDFCVRISAKKDIFNRKSEKSLWSNFLRDHDLRGSDPPPAPPTYANEDHFYVIILGFSIFQALKAVKVGAFLKKSKQTSKVTFRQTNN